jgi:excisionase family DNA binding protein
MNSSNDRPPPSQPEGLWSAIDVARYLKVSKSWVYHHAESGELPCIRVGPLVRFEPEAIRSFARGKTHGTVVPFPRKPGDVKGR